MMSTKDIIQTIKENERFLISTHVNPDPDALCSQLALAIYLKSLGKKVFIINHEEVPGRFHFLAGIRAVKPYNEKMKISYDAAIVVDCGDLRRIGKVQGLIRKDKPLINIDHHITNESFGVLNLVRPEASSTGEVLYDLLKEAKCIFTKNLAMHLYAGIMTDTGSFRYENTSSRTHAIAADLMTYKFSAPTLYRKLYEAISADDLKEFTKVISRFDMLYGGKVVCVELRKNVLAKFSGEFDLRDTIFKFLRSMKSVEVFVIFTEIEPGKTRVNLRSTEKFDVAKLANYFKGGGHRRASGCVVNKNILGARKDVLEKIKEVL
jgi:phosphoesterase RecJ-like protein